MARCQNVSHLKIQKLLYYIQGYHLAFFDAPIIDDNFEAWVHGPVSRNLYMKMKDGFGEFFSMHDEISDENLNLEEIEKTIQDQITTDQFDVLDDVIDMLQGYSGTDLERATHREAPWMNARKWLGPADKSSNLISNDDMRNYFLPLIVADA